MEVETYVMTLCWLCYEVDIMKLKWDITLFLPRPLTGAEGKGHGFMSAVRQCPIPPPIWLQQCILGFAVFAFTAFRSLRLVFARADAYDAVYKPALGLLLLQVVVLRNAVDQVADLVGLAWEWQVWGTLGQLFDLVQFIKLQKLLGN